MGARFLFLLLDFRHCCLFIFFNMKDRLPICCVSCLMLLIGILSGMAMTDATNKRIVCYYVSWTSGYKHPYNYDTRDIPTALCTDVVFAFMTMDSETWELNNNQDPEKLRQLTFFGSGGVSSGPNFLLGVGGQMDDSSKWSAMVGDASKRSSFVSSALRLVREYGFDGIDLYWNDPPPEDRENYVKLVEELAVAFRPSGLLLSSTVNLMRIVLINDTGYDIQRLSELLDWINVKTCYMRGPWNDFVDVHSPLYRRQFEQGKMKYLNVHDGLEILGQLGAPRHKLLVCIPFYGTSYTLRNGRDNHPGAPANKSAGGGEPGPIVQKPGFLAYYEICRGVMSGKWTRRFDHEAKCPYAFRGNQWVGYEDEQSIRIKMEYVRNRGYGGAFVWSVNFDDFNGFCGSKNPLLHALHDSLSEKKDEQTVDSSESMLRKRYEAMGIVPTCKC